MSVVLLKENNKDNYVKSVNWVDGKVEFTSSPLSAKRYKSDWFAIAERQQLEHYSQLPYEEGGLEGDLAETVAALSVYFY